MGFNVQLQFGLLDQHERATTLKGKEASFKSTHSLSTLLGVYVTHMWRAIHPPGAVPVLSEAALIAAIR